jgi:hypothetical protein
MWGIPPPFCHNVRGKKGGQSPLSSIIYKKENMGYMLKKFWKNFMENRGIDSSSFGNVFGIYFTNLQ